MWCYVIFFFQISFFQQGLLSFCQHGNGVQTHARTHASRPHRRASAHGRCGLPERLRRRKEPGGHPPPCRLLPAVRRSIRDAHGKGAPRALRVHQGRCCVVLCSPSSRPRSSRVLCLCGGVEKTRKGGYTRVEDSQSCYCEAPPNRA